MRYRFQLAIRQEDEVRATVIEAERPAVVLIYLEQTQLSGVLFSHLVLVRLGEQTVSVARRLVRILELYLLGRQEYALIGSLPAHLIRLEIVGAARIEDARLGVIIERAVHIAEIIVERREDIQHSLVRQESVGVVVQACRRQASHTEKACPPAGQERPTNGFCLSADALSRGYE